MTLASDSALVWLPMIVLSLKQTPIAVFTSSCTSASRPTWFSASSWQLLPIRAFLYHGPGVGVSPRVRGVPVHDGPAVLERRRIPACAGSLRDRAAAVLPCEAHPARYGPGAAVPLESPGASRRVFSIVVLIVELLQERPDLGDGSARAHSRFPGHALTPTGVMAIRCKQFHLPDL